jgi:DNA repair photolyase
LSEKTRRILEPRTTTIKKRLKVVKVLSANGIPVNVMLAPIIPSINSHEILPMAKIASEFGATSIAHTVVRLNGTIGEIFTDWIKKTLPHKADKVLNQIKDCHGGSLNESRFGIRIKGEGQFASQINDLVKLAKHKYFKDKAMPKLNKTLFGQHRDGQLSLF